MATRPGRTLIATTTAVSLLGVGAAADAVHWADISASGATARRSGPTTSVLYVEPVIELTAPQGTSAPADGTSTLCILAVVKGTTALGTLTVTIGSGPNAGPSQSVLLNELNLCYTSVLPGSDTIVANWTGPVLESGQQLVAWPQQVVLEWTPVDNATGGGDPGSETAPPNNPQITLTVTGPTSAPADGQTELCFDATVTGNVVSGATTLAVTSGPNAGWSMTERGWFGSCLTSSTPGVDTIVATWTDNDGEVQSNAVQLEWTRQSVAAAITTTTVESVTPTTSPAPSPPPQVEPFVEILRAAVDCAGTLHLNWQIGAVPEPAPQTEHLVLVNPVSDPIAITAVEVVDQPVNSADFALAIPASAEAHRVHVIVDFEPANAEGILLVAEAAATVEPGCEATTTSAAG